MVWGVTKDGIPPYLFIVPVPDLWSAPVSKQRKVNSGHTRVQCGIQGPVPGLDSEDPECLIDTITPWVIKYSESSARF